MNFKLDIEWSLDAGPPRRSLAKMGGITEISPAAAGLRQQCDQPRRGDGKILPHDFREGASQKRHYIGIVTLLRNPAGAGLISDVPPGQTLPSTLKVHDTL